MTDICVIGGNGFVGFSICSELQRKKTNFVKITRQNYSSYKNKKFKIIINAAMPSKRFWAKNNPDLDYEETVTKTKNIISDFKFEKIIHVSTVSARCQFHTTYGKNKKESEDLIKQTPNYLIIRLGPMYGVGLTKGVLVDMLNNGTVFFNGKSKYSFTDVSWNAKWIINNLNLKNQLVEVGATDYIELEKLAKLINSSAKFDGEIDDQIILNKSYKYNSTKDVLNFLKTKKKI